MKKILVVEDEKPLREDIVEILECLDFEVVNAENGRIGVEVAQTEVPDLILCDVMMPELDGYGVLKSLHQNPITATIPFIFLSAKSDKSDIRQGMNLGADDYLTKPFTIAELEEAIAACLEKSERRKQANANNLESQELAQQEKILEKLNQQINNSVAVNRIINSSLVAIRHLLKTHRCGFFVYHGDVQSPYFQLIDEAVAPEAIHLSNLNAFKEVTALADAILQHNRLQIDNIATAIELEPQVHQQLSSLGLTSLLAVTTQIPSGEVGVLMCENFNEPRPWSENEVDLLQAVADQLPIAL